MSDSDWAHGASVVGIITLVVAYSLTSHWWLDGANKEQYAYTKQQCTIYKSQHSRMPWPVVSREIKKAATNNQRTQKPDYKKKDNTDWCDLAAQESMAKATVGMERAAWAAVILTLIGVGLLGFTLHHTRRAADSAKEMVDEAKLTTAAARETVDVTREISEFQISAFIKFDAKAHDGGQLCISGDVINVGKSIARDIVLRASAEYFKDGEAFFSEELNVKQAPTGILGSGTDERFSIWSKRALVDIYDGNVIEFGEPGSSWIKAKIICRYKNAFGNWWVSEYEAQFHFPHYSMLDAETPNIGQSEPERIRERIYKFETQNE